jgi:aminoglycoside phosphotransferase (APT) family kinase protein
VTPAPSSAATAPAAPRADPNAAADLTLERAALTPYAVVRYLLDQRLLDAEDVVDGGLVVVDASRRNCNFKVLRSRPPSYLVKRGVGADGLATVAREAAVYALLADGPADPAPGHNLPRWFGYDAGTGTLVLELVRGTHDLHEHHGRVARFSKALARAVGRALARLHGVLDEDATRGDVWVRLSDEPPWTLGIHRPTLEDYCAMSSGAASLVRMVQQSDDLCDALDRLRGGWQRTAVIHGDLRWENCVVLPGRGSAASAVQLVDWEFARIGDPDWDVGSMLANYLSTWLLSIPTVGDGADMPAVVPLAALPIERMQPAVGTFWAAYAAATKLAPAESGSRLLRAVRYAGARLVQTAYEQSQPRPEVTEHVVRLLQASLNIMRRPHEAAAQLLAIELADAR